MSPRHVNPLERGNVAFNDSPLLGDRFGLRVRVDAGLGEAGPCPLQRTVDARSRRAEEAGDLGRRQLEHLLEDERRPLARREQLQRSHQCKPKAAPLDHRRRRIALERLQPRHLEGGHERCLGIIKRRAHPRWQRPARPALEGVQAGVRRGTRYSHVRSDARSGSKRSEARQARTWSPARDHRLRGPTPTSDSSALGAHDGAVLPSLRNRPHAQEDHSTRRRPGNAGVPYAASGGPALDDKATEGVGSQRVIERQAVDLGRIPRFIGRSPDASVSSQRPENSAGRVIGVSVLVRSPPVVDRPLPIIERRKDCRPSTPTIGR